jgi:hypothetical protein
VVIKNVIICQNLPWQVALSATKGMVRLVESKHVRIVTSVHERGRLGRAHILEDLERSADLAFLFSPVRIVKLALNSLEVTWRLVSNIPHKVTHASSVTSCDHIKDVSSLSASSSPVSLTSHPLNLHHLIAFRGSFTIFITIHVHRLNDLTHKVFFLSASSALTLIIWISISIHILFAVFSALVAILIVLIIIV